MRLLLLIASVAVAAVSSSPYISGHHSDGAGYYHYVDHTNRASYKSSEDAAYWTQLGQKMLKKELGKQIINKQAKNVILFLGDGMSIPTVTASRIYKGQKLGKTGEEAELVFDQFPFGALSRTYCVDSQVADSACSATAYLAGVKTNIDTIGIDANVQFGNCTTQNIPEYHVNSIMHWAQVANKGTGIVTTTRVTHATPAGTYAHVAHRDWEDDSYIHSAGIDTNTCSDIAEQLVETKPGNKLKVILGGGRHGFFPNTVKDPESGEFCHRLDGKNLVEQWKKQHANGAYVTTKDELAGLDLSRTDSVLGLFSAEHMEYYLETEKARKHDWIANNPTLEEMTRSAINMLKKDANGFVLLVEGGRIDMAHHEGRAKFALEETYQFDLAISAALELTDRQDTLIVVTADHAHTMSINGYPIRGNPILGLNNVNADDGKPYTTLSYANGPGYKTAFSPDGVRPDLTKVNTAADDFLQPATVPLSRETHGGDDVAIFATGPQAHLFQGVYEQNYIAHVMAYASCIGPGLTYCGSQ